MQLFNKQMFWQNDNQSLMRPPSWGRTVTIRRGRLGAGRLCAGTFMRLDFYAPRLLGARGKKIFSKKIFFQKKIFFFSKKSFFFKKKIFFHKNKFFSEKKFFFSKKHFFSTKKTFFFPNFFFLSNDSLFSNKNFFQHFD